MVFVCYLDFSRYRVGRGIKCGEDIRHCAREGLFSEGIDRKAGRSPLLEGSIVLLRDSDDGLDGSYLLDDDDRELRGSHIAVVVVLGRNKARDRTAKYGILCGVVVGELRLLKGTFCLFPLRLRDAADLVELIHTDVVALGIGELQLGLE